MAAQKEQMAVYSLPSFTCTKEITLDFKNPGVVRASKDYAVVRNNEINVLHLFDLSTGKGQTSFETIFSGEEKAFLDKKRRNPGLPTLTLRIAWPSTEMILLLSSMKKTRLSLN